LREATEHDHTRAAQITSELEDCKLLITIIQEDIAHMYFLVIGSDFSQFRTHLACCLANVATEPSFTDWLFEEAAKGVFGPEVAQSPPPTIEQVTEPEASREGTFNVVNDSSRTVPNVPRNGVYQQAITQVLPPTSTSAQKRTASARSPSPNHPNKSRRTDLPVGPRAMYRDGNSNSNANPHPNSRSLLDRVGGPAGRPGPKNFQRDEIQARIDNIVGNTPDPNMMMAAGFPGMGMDMNAIAAANMGNPLMLQEMMMNQMALMAQMASSMGIINPNTGQFAGQGFPMQQGVMPGDMGMFPNGMIDGFPQQGGNSGPMNGAGRGRGSVRGARGSSRGRGGSVGGNSAGPSTNTSASTIENPHVSRPPIPIVEPKPVTPLPTTPAPSAAVLIAAPATSQQLAYVVPDRPQSPTLCKFALKCTNAHCRYSHPSPVATAESGVVLSNEACPNGKECKDKDCIKAHVSPAALNPLGNLHLPKISTLAYLFLPAAAEQPAPIATTPHVQHTPTPCRFGSACTRPGCTFSHPPRPSHNHFAQQCRFGAGCTRAQCPFQHPEGRVLPSSFHRGLSTTGPMVNVSTPEPGSMGGPSPHRSVTFNTATASESVKEKLERQMKEIQEKKSEAERAVRNAEAAANKKDEAKPVSIAV